MDAPACRSLDLEVYTCIQNPSLKPQELSFLREMTGFMTEAGERVSVLLL